MWSVEDLKPYLLHEKKYVRDFVAFYLAQGRPTDTALMELVFEGIERFGLTAQLHVLRHAFWFPVTESIIERCVAQLEGTTDRDIALALNWILSETPADAFAKHNELLRGCRQVDVWALQRMKHRAELHDLQLTGQELWDELKELAFLCDRAEGTPQEIDAGADQILLAALAQQSVPTADEICQQLRETSEFGGWMDRFLIELAGRRRIASAAPEIVRRLGSSNDVLTQRAAFALGQIGDPQTVHAIQAIYAEMSFENRTGAILALERIRCQEAEAALIALWVVETDQTLRQLICDGLCVLGSKLGVDTVLDQVSIGGTIDWNVDSLLIPNAILHDITLPDHDECLASLEARLNEQEELRQVQLRIDHGHPNAVPRARMATPKKLKAPALQSTIRREVSKAGRNDPCPCGSGHKFKKCCGQ